ncbi:MAG: hypothetical protein RLO21_22620, partial [Nitratireductor sp.]
MAMLGVPYGEAVNNAPELAREQARAVSDEIYSQSSGTTEDVSDRRSSRSSHTCSAWAWTSASNRLLKHPQEAMPMQQRAKSRPDPKTQK